MSAWKLMDVIKWKRFPCYWPFVRWPVNSPHKGQRAWTYLWAATLLLWLFKNFRFRPEIWWGDALYHAADNVEIWPCMTNFCIISYQPTEGAVVFWTFPWTLWPLFRRRHFRECKVLYFDSNFTKVCSYRSNWQYVNIGSGYDFAPNRRQGWPEPLAKDR